MPSAEGVDARGPIPELCGSAATAPAAPIPGDLTWIVVALDLLGDCWTLLLLRDLSRASLRFVDLQAINPGISPNLLARRLRWLETGGMVIRRRPPPPGRAAVYELPSDVRAQVLPILNALGRSGAGVFERMPASPAVGADPRPAWVERTLGAGEGSGRRG